MIDFHRRMLADRVRNAAFEQALRSVVKKGETVVADIGAGTGVLGFLAARMGTKKCYLYEQGDILAIAKRVAQENGIKQCVFVQEHSTAVREPPKVNVLVCETLGNFAYEEHILETLADAKRFLAPGGRMIPCGITNIVAPVVTDRVHKELLAFRASGTDLDFAAAEEVAFNNIYVRTFSPKELLPGQGSARVWDRVQFPGKNASVRSATAVWEMGSPATIYGFALWWEAELVPGVTLSTSPEAPATHWEQIYAPLRTPIAAKAGDRIELRLTSDSRWQTGINVTWKAEHRRSDALVSAQAYDMRRGMA